MPKLASLGADSRFSGLFIGPRHSGKSCAAASFTLGNDPERPRTIDYDFDNRVRGIQGSPAWEKIKDLVDYEYYPPKMGANNKSVFEKVNKDFETLLINCQKGQNRYGTIILDSLTNETKALVFDALAFTHNIAAKGSDKRTGKFLGTMAMPGPEDYGFEAEGTYQVMAFLRSLPFVNVIVTAHVVPLFVKEDPENPFSNTVERGERLSIRDKISANISTYFDHIFRFDRRMVGREERFFVRFRSDIACTSFSELPNGEIDITGKPFYEVLMGYLNKGSAVQQTENPKGA